MPVLPSLLLSMLPVAVATPGVDRAQAPITAGCNGHGALAARLHGDIERNVEWQDLVMSCDGSLRPDGSGLRLTASGPLPGRLGQMRVLLGIAGAKPGVDARNLGANLTLIVGEPGRIFATRGADKCTIDELVQRPLPRSTPGKALWKVQARGFCISPATALNGRGRILVSRFDLRTAVTLDVLDRQD